MHTTTITRADRAALENLWGSAGTWAADTWTRLNTTHFKRLLHYHGIVWGLTPHGSRLGHTSHTGRITLHPALLDPQGEDPWLIKEHTLDSAELGARYAEDTLLHEMVHAALFDRNLTSDHNDEPWCAEIMRITPRLGLPPIKAAPVKPRRIDGKVMRAPLPGYLPLKVIAAWPHPLRLFTDPSVHTMSEEERRAAGPALSGYYTSEGRIHVPI